MLNRKTPIRGDDASLVELRKRPQTTPIRRKRSSSRVPLVLLGLATGAGILGIGTCFAPRSDDDDQSGGGNGGGGHIVTGGHGGGATGAARPATPRGGFGFFGRGGGS